MQHLQFLWKYSKNTFYLLFYRIQGKSYPAKILPKSSYQKKLDINSICDKQELNIVYRSNFNITDTFNDLGNVRGKVFDRNTVPTLSMNLLGGNFQKEHIKYRPKMKTSAVEKWSGNEVFLSDLINDYEELKIYTAIIYSSSSLNKARILFKFDLSDRSEKAIVRKLLNTPKLLEETFTAEGKLAIIHDPTNINYWHLELQMEDYNKPSNTIRNASNKRNASAATFVIDHILTINGKTDMEINLIPKSLYQKPERK